MRSNLITALVVVGATLADSLSSQSADQSNNIPSCRFVFEWSQEEVLSNPDGFINDLLYWEGQFHQNNVSYNTGNGMTYDGTQLDWVTGERTDKHTFSAPSKEVRNTKIKLPR